MRYILPMALGLLALGCSIPKAHDPNLVKHPQIPYQEEGNPEALLSDGSLWQDRFPVSDLRARRINDLVTIRITESTTATVKGDLNTSRVGANTYNAPAFFKAFSSVGAAGASGSSATGTGGVPTNATSNTFKGAGTTDRSAVFTTTVTARVVKVLGNGNLVFEGFQDIQLNNEKQRLYIAGMVDPARLDVNNSIPSTGVAELKVGYGGAGVVDETTKPGYVSRLLNYIWPF